MHKAIIADSSCFIILSNIGELDLLRKVYGQIITTIEVCEEYGDAMPAWVIVEGAKDIYRLQILSLQVDRGESSAIALALETDNCILIVDDNKARKLAHNLGIEITGTLGVIVKAKLNGVIPSVKPYLEKIKMTDFRFTTGLFEEVMKQAGEI